MTIYLVSGGTGFIGQNIIKELKKDPENRIIVISRDYEKARKILGEDVDVVCADLSEPIDLNELGLKDIRIDKIIHCAANTESKKMMEDPVGTLNSIVISTINMLRLALMHRETLKGMVFLSSMEVYGSVEDIGRPRKEEELGYIDISSKRSCYPMGKRMAEHYCFLYATQYGLPIKTARLSQVFGSGVREDDNRVFMQMAKSVASGNDIVLKTDGMSYGNYCATEDAVSGILLIINNGETGQVYNVVNEENTMRIIDMARLVSEKFSNGMSRVIIEGMVSEKTEYAKNTELKMSSEKLRLLGWKPTKNMESMYEDIFRSLK